LEVNAIAAAFSNQRSIDCPLYIGSVKTNIGHTEATSGIASIIKVSLALEKGLIPPNAQYEKPNEKLHLKDRNIEVIPLSLENGNK
jgi:acyl transferase domain-containing protein